MIEPFSATRLPFRHGDELPQRQRLFASGPGFNERAGKPGRGGEGATELELSGAVRA